MKLSQSYFPILALAFFFALLALLESPWHERLEGGLSDAFFQLRGTEDFGGEIVILGINSESMEFFDDEIDAHPDLGLLTDWPWPREVHARLLDKLVDAGARVVAFDVLFLGPSLYGDGDDALLREALERHAERVVVASDFEKLDQGRGRSQLMVPFEDVVPPALRNEMTGYVSYWPDRGGVIRRATFETTEAVATGLSRRPLEGEVRLRSLPAAIVEKADEGANIPGWASYPIINYSGPSGTFARYPVFQVLHDRYWERNLRGGNVFDDKIVLIGATAGFMQDSHQTPFGAMAGVEVHANAVRMLMEESFPREATLAGEIGLTLFAALCMTGILRWGGPYLLKFVLIGLAGAAWFGVSFVLFDRANFLVVTVSPYVALFGAGLSGLALQFSVEQVEKRRLRRTFDTFVSPDVAEYLMEHPEDYEKMAVGKRRRCVVLFSDVRGFTTLCEQAETPEELVGQLNEYLSAWVECVFENHGTLDKFVGDAVMAVWGGIHSRGEREDALAAVKAALDMRERLQTLNAEWRGRSLPELRIGIGINVGEAIVGNMGSPGRKLEFTAVGDAVNVAARLEGETKKYGKAILVSEAVYRLIQDEIDAEWLAESEIRGRTGKVGIYSVDGAVAPGARAERRSPTYSVPSSKLPS